MRRMAASAGRHFRIFLLLESLAVHRCIILGNLIDTQRRIISPHEIWVRVAFAADFNDLKTRGLADKTLFLVHRFQAHGTGVAAMASDTAKTFHCVDIRLEQFGRFGQILDPQRRMTGRTAIVFRLGSGDNATGQINK